MEKIYLIDVEEHTPYVIDGEALIGRDNECDLCWPSSSLAPKHLCVSHKNDNFFVEALENKTPVSLNGVVILAGQKYLVKKGDRLEFAHKKFIFSMTDELPEKTVSKIRGDVLGFGPDTDSAITFGELKLDTDYGANKIKLPKNEMKKSRRIIVEIQQTKKELKKKLEERSLLEKEKRHLSGKIDQLQNELKKGKSGQAGEFFSKREADFAEIEVLENKINELKVELLELTSKRDRMKAELNEETHFVDLFKEEEELVEKLQNLDIELEKLQSLDLEEKITKLDECLKLEQENYQRLHDFKTLNSSHKKKYG